MIRLVQIALLLAIVVPNGMARAQVDVQKPLLDQFLTCAVNAFVDHEFSRRDADPERAFARCATEEQRIMTSISLIRSERTQRLAYSLFVKRKADLKVEMIEMLPR